MNRQIMTELTFRYSPALAEIILGSKVRNKSIMVCKDLHILVFAGQVKGDGSPACFSNVEDTGIPGLQKWCHTLTFSSRQRSARNFFSQLQIFATSVQTYVRGIDGVTLADREALRKKWETPNEEAEYDSAPFLNVSGSELYSIKSEPRANMPTGVALKLAKVE